MRLTMTITLAVILALAPACAGKKKTPAPEPAPAPAPTETAPAPAPPPAPAPKPATPARLTAADIDDIQRNVLVSVHFDFDKYNLMPETMTTLERHAKWLKEHTTVKLVVEGHCDERGTVDYNLALGERRAQTVKQYLVSLGVASGRLSTISYGKEKPADPRSNETAWAKNRRAEFVITEY
jgi:peptidoglycan-associated lipoprotein